jgi:hypothetical protein
MITIEFVVMNYDRGLGIFEIDIDIPIFYFPVNTAVVIISTAVAEMVNPISISKFVSSILEELNFCICRFLFLSVDVIIGVHITLPCTFEGSTDHEVLIA